MGDGGGSTVEGSKCWAVGLKVFTCGEMKHKSAARGDDSGISRAVNCSSVRCRRVWLLELIRE